MLPVVVFAGTRTTAWPRDLRAPRHAPSALADVLHRRWESDAWFQAVSLPSGVWPLSPGGPGASWPRLAKTALHRIEAEWLADGPHDPTYTGPALAYAVADLDRAPHEPWPSAQAAEAALEAWDATGGPPPVALFATARGLRAIWALARPVPLVYAQSWLDAWYAQPDGLSAHVPAGIRAHVTIDTSTDDWTRGFRVPWCVRDDGVVAAWGDAPAPMVWRADATPLAWFPRSTLRHEIAGADAETPRLPETPTPPVAWRAYVRPDSVAGKVAAELEAGRPIAGTGGRNVSTWKVVASLAAQLDRDAPAPSAESVYGVVAASAAAQGEPSLPALWAMAVRAVRLETVGRAQAAAEAAERGAAVEAAARAAEAEFGPVLLQCGPSVWVREVDGPSYFGPTSKTTARAGLRAHPIVMTTPQGKALDWDTVFQRHGAALDRVEYGYDTVSAFDQETGALMTSAANYRSPEPERSAGAESWLEALLSEAEPETREAALDWLATANDPAHRNQPTAALYLQGPKSAGKGLLAASLAQPWGVAPTPLATALGPRKAGLLRTPIVFLDEGMELDRGGTAAFRTLTGERTHEIDEKYKAPVTLRGALRVVVGANNPRALGIAEIDSLDDLDAIADRVLHVRVSAAAVPILRGDALPEGPARPAEIARHFAWLATVRKVRPGPRWVVQGIRSTWHDRLLVTIPRYADVIEVLYLGLVKRPKPLWSLDPDGGLIVAPMAVHGAWASLTGIPRPRLTALAQTLAALSDGGRVSSAVLAAWADAVGAA